MTGSGLPELDALLDPASLLARLATIADERAALVGAKPFYLRWKPGTSALLGVRLTWQTADGLAETLASLYLGEGRAEAAAKARSQRLLDPPLGPALAETDDALFIAFPNDRLLKGLNAVADERRVGNRLAAAPDSPFGMRALRVKARGSSVRPVRWKPGRRAVLELDLKLVDDATDEREQWHAFARVMPADELDGRVARWRAAAAVRALAAPAVVFVDHERGWFATAAAPGRALAAAPGDSLRAALRAALAELHAAPTPALATRPDTDERDAALRALEGLARVAPDLERRTHALATRIAAAHAALAPCAPVFTHGDLGADQLLVDGARVSVIDWDEAANGDPHFDHASLAADVRGRGLDSAWVEGLAREVLGDRFDPARYAWQCAAAEARRATEGLQRGRADWRARALDVLDAAERALAAAPAPASALAPATRPAPGTGTWLAALLDPSGRMGVPGVDAAASRVAAVWPEGEGGAIVRLERAGEPGRVVRWLRVGEAVEAFDFPADPGLPALAPLLASGRFSAAGHRFGKRAALRETGGGRFLFLRPAGAVAKAFARVSEAHRRLEGAGVASSRPLGLADEAPGWWAEAVAGRALDPAREDAAVWRELGATLARAHAAHGVASTPAGGLAASVAAGRKQVALVRLADPAFADELDRALDQVPLGLPAGHAAYLHGDLHPLQVVVGERLVVLDWERARVGEAEEDLGNLYAHLAWEARDAVPAARAAFLQGYTQAGGRYDKPLALAHARASLARVRAVHGWRDGSRERARDGALWQGWLEEISR